MMQRLARSAFVRKAGVLSAGTVAGQVLLVAVTPLLTRLYGVEDFAVLGLMVALFGVIGIVPSLRYELLLPLAKDEKAFGDSLLLSLVAVVVFGGVLGLVLGFGGGWILPPLGMELLVPYVWLVVVIFLLVGIYNALSLALTCQGKVKAVSATKIDQAANAVTVQVMMGALVAGPLGLLVGFGVSQASGVLSFWRKLQGTMRDAWARNSPGRLWKLARKNWKFPVISAPAAMVGRLSGSVPLPMLAAFYGPEVAGWFVLGQRLLAMPMVLVGRAVAQVFVAEFGRRTTQGKGNLDTFFLKVSGSLFAVGVPVIGVLMVAGPWLFEVVFGEGWREAGEYARLLAAMYVAQFAVAPLAQTLNLSGRQFAQFVWDVGRLAATVLALAVPYYLGWDARGAIGCLGVAMTVAYLVQMVVCTVTLRADERKGR
jgi:O-antigen/teichoic acid export membrane protein